MSQFKFTFENLRKEYETAIETGYSILTCSEFCGSKNKLAGQKVLVNRVDVDFSVKKAGKLLDLFETLGIKGTFFIRLHAPEYNPFDFESYRIIRKMIDCGHEIGYHSEIIDQAMIWGEDPEKCLRRDMDVLNRMFDIQITGVASHGGFTGLNNLDFWKNRTPEEFGLLYEGYDKRSEFNLFQEALYISDSEWLRWKCYDKGKRVENDHRSLSEHLVDSPELIYFLIHPDTYFNNHFYE